MRDYIENKGNRFLVLRQVEGNEKLVIGNYYSSVLDSELCGNCKLWAMRESLENFTLWFHSPSLGLASLLKDLKA